MTHLRYYAPSSCAALLLLMSACKDEPTGPENFTVSLSTINLQHLENGQGHYELWISFPEESAHKRLAKPVHGDEAFVSFGKFNLSSNNGQIVNLSGQAMIFEPTSSVDINLAVDALVTVELEGDNDDKPGSRLLGGEFRGSDREATALMSTSAGDAFGFDYRIATASYVLTTPTTDDSTDFKSGIWWITRGATISTGIDKLIVLADTARWRYEGWILDKTTSTAYSTGKFLNAFGADADFAGTTAGSDGLDQNNDGRGDGFAFPGQDFVRANGGIPAFAALDNGSFAAFITIEPQPDNNAAPFYLTLLADDMIGPNLASRHDPQTMENRAVFFPSATVKITR